MLQDTTTGLVENIDPALIGGGGTPISSLTAATGVNTINNGSYGQMWQWNSLGTGYTNGLQLSSSSTVQTSTSNILGISVTGTHGTSGQETRGLLVSNTKSGTTSLNIGIKSAAYICQYYIVLF